MEIEKTQGVHLALYPLRLAGLAISRVVECAKEGVAIALGEVPLVHIDPVQTLESE
jgi:hypothetical protein